VVGFANHGREVFNITRLAASLHYPLDYRYHVQNVGSSPRISPTLSPPPHSVSQFTDQSYVGIPVGPNEEVSIAYTLHPDPLLEPRDFGLTVNVFYLSRGANWTNLVFNSTVYLVETGSAFDPQSCVPCVCVYV